GKARRRLSAERRLGRLGARVASRFRHRRKDCSVKRFRAETSAVAGPAGLMLAVPPVAAGQSTPARGKAGFHQPFCQSAASLCADAYDDLGGQYVGHAEPSVEFKSSVPGSGNDITYTVTLPRNPRRQPFNKGPEGPTWDFQLRPTFWFGLTLCDTESAPEFTKVCNPDTDANDLFNPDPNAPDYIGKHPGNAF